MYEISEVVVPGGVLKYQAKDIKELIELSAFIQSLPKVCPCDGTPTRFLFQDFDGDKYYGVVGTGPIEYVYKYGIAKDGGDLFPKGRWSFFHAPIKKELVVMENGQICPKCWWWDNTKSEKIFVNVPNPLSTPANVGGNGKPLRQAQGAVSELTFGEVQHRNIADSAELDSVINEALANGTGVTQDDGGWPEKKLPVVNPATIAWPVDGDALQMCADLTNYEVSLSKTARGMIDWAKEKHATSGGKFLSTASASGKSQYGYLVSLVDAQCGKGSHRAVLSALCGVQVSSANPPGWKLKELLDFLVAKNAKTLGGLTDIAMAIKNVLVEVAA